MGNFDLTFDFELTSEPENKKIFEKQPDPF